MHTLPKEISGYEYDKRYIGVTAKEFPRLRWKNGSKYRFSDMFYKDIKKFGWDNIIHEVLAIWDNEVDGYESEQRFIELLDTCNPQKGYNRSIGGKGPFGMCGEKNANFGRHHSESVRRKMSANHADFRLGKHPLSKKTYQFDKSYRFVAKYGALTEAAIINHYDRSCIERAVRKHQLSHGYFWAYEEDVCFDNGEITLKEKWPLPSHGQKEVYQFDMEGNYITKYPSCCDAGKALGINDTNIGAAARHLHKCIGGYQWRYEKDVIELSDNPSYYRIKV